MVSIHAVPAFKDNYIWVLAENGRAAAVDPGESLPVERLLEKSGLELTAILATNHHGDHVGGVPALVEHWQCPVFGPAHETIPEIRHPLVEGDRITVPGFALSFAVLDIPAHTAGHIAFVDSGDEPLTFCGDTLFACGCGRLFEGTARQMSESLAKLAALDRATRVYCGHEYTLANIGFAQAVEPGNTRLSERKAREEAKRSRGEPTLPSTIGEELATNPFLRCTQPGVIASAERHAGRRLADAVEVFAEIRAWKNSF
jgi:hydroxyacylglutathione hydrolase